MKYQLLKYSLLSLLVMLCGNVFADYEKVTSTADITSGKYLIVYEAGNVAFNGALESLDASDNTVAVTISEGKIASSATIDDATFKIDVANGYLQSSSGKYIGINTNSNGLKSASNATEFSNAFSIDGDGNAVIAAVFEGSSMTMRYNSASNQNRFRYYKSGQQPIQLYKQITGGETDKRKATTLTLTFDDNVHRTSGFVGEELELPGVTIKAGETTINEVPTWSSSDETVAIYYEGKVKLLKVGTTTMTATYEGNATYKPSSDRYTLTVTAAPYTSFSKLQEDATLTSTPIAVQFNGQQVVYVNGSNAYIADKDGYGLLVYTKNHGLEAGNVLSGTINCNLVLYQGAAEITGFSKEGLTITTADVVPVEKTIGGIGIANQSILVTLKEVKYDATDGMLTDGKNTIKYYDKFKTNAELNAEDTYNVTGIVVIYNDVIEICPRTADDVVAVGQDEPAGFKDFAVIVNNQEGTLLTAGEQVQGTEVEFGVAVNENGETVRVAVNDAKSIATVSGKYHSDHGMTGLNLITSVPGAVKILVGQCTYSTKEISVIDATGKVVAKATPAAACWKNDRSNVTELVYNGGATMLSITGMDYCPFVAVQKTEAAPEPVSEDITGTWDFGNTDVMTTTMALSGSTEAGEVEALEKNGLKMMVEANGASFRNNGNNIQVRTGAVFKIPVKNAGDLVTVKGYPGYSKYTIGNSSEQLTDENTYKAKLSDAEAGYVAVTSADDNNYYYLLSVVQYAPKEKITLDNEAATIAFAFNEGTEGQTATFSEASYFLNSKVTHGSNLTLKDKYTLTDAETQASVVQTRFEPATKLDKADEASAVRFMFTPKPGFTFMPTRVSLNATRYGTDNGLIDVTWETADGNNIVLATGVKPERNNKNPNISKLSYEVSGATATEGTQVLLLHLYSLQEAKQFGLNDIVIEGTLNGTEKDVPILASFKVNGIEYTVEDVFGESYEATLELPKAQAMVSAENPLTDVTATSGEVGTITYEGTEDACKVTIPMTAGDTQMDYVLNVVFKPDFTLSYIAVDGTTVLKTQIVEKDAAIGQFAYDIADVASSRNGYKARGWFKQNYLGEKFSTADVITANTNLYALETEIEVPSDSRKYVYDLTNQFFYDEDHEGFNSDGSGYWHDKQHGWAFNNGDKIELLVGKKATINFALCQYSASDATIIGSNGASVTAKADSDGGAGSFDYEGEEGTLTLTIRSNGAVYIHGITVFNTSEPNFAKQGDWLIVKKGDASSLLDAIEVAKGIENAKIFLPEGTYDLGQTAKTIISGKNVSLIGQNAEKTVIVNHPAQEGLDVADLLKNTGEGLYMQDISLKNDYSYGGNDGRAASLHDTGTKTVCKNVFLLSHQDTYYSHKVGGLYYWEGGELHGTVDYLCGNGKVYYNEVKLVNEVRGTATLTANSELYVFNNCTVENHAGTYNLGRAWSDNPVCVYLNTTLLDGGEKLLGTRWNLSGLNCDYSLASEYGTKDANGNDITPESNVVTFTKQSTTMNTILNAEQAARFTIDYVLGDWAATAQASAKQVAAPVDATINSGSVAWTAVAGASAYALFKNGEFVALITEGTSYAIGDIASSDKLTIRSANARGGLGQEASVEDAATGIRTVGNAETTGHDVYNMQGMRVEKAQKGLYIINGKKVIR